MATKKHDKKNIKQTKKDTKKSMTRVQKNEKLYHKKEQEELSNTKQQKFNFDNNSLEDEMDNTFVNKKNKEGNKPIAKEIKSNNKQKNKKTKYPLGTVIGMALVIILLSSVLIIHYLTFDHEKISKTKQKLVQTPPENIVFLGDSITYGYDLEKFYEKRHVVNSGIGGNTTKDLLNDLDGRVYKYNPSKVFLLIGTNDYERDFSNDKIVTNIQKIIKKIKKNRNKAKIYVESIYPVNSSVDNSNIGKRNNKDFKKINKDIKKVCKKEKITYINMYDELLDEKKELRKEFTKDGLHLTDKGYEKVTFVLKKYIEE